MAYLLLILVLAGLIYAGWRLTRLTAARPKTRVIGPDDDPDFLRRLGHGDKSRSPAVATLAGLGVRLLCARKTIGDHGRQFDQGLARLAASAGRG